MLFLNLLLSLTWLLITGDFSFPNFLLGLILGYLGLRFISRTNSELYQNQVSKTIRFFFYFLWQIVASSIRVAITVLSPKMPINPGVVAVPLRLQTDSQITLLANLITLTPGTLSLDVSADRKVIFVHVMDLDDVDAFRAEIRDGFEQRILDITG